MTLTTERTPAPAPSGPALSAGRGRADLAFRLFTGAAGVFVLVLLAAIAIFLIVKALPALGTTSATSARPRRGTRTTADFGIAALAFGSARDRVHRAGHRVAGRAWRWPCSSRSTPLAGSPAAWATCSTCSPRFRASCTACGGCSAWCPT